MLKGVKIAMSGLSVWKRSDRGLDGWPSRSACSMQFSLMTPDIHFTRRDSTESWRSLWRSRKAEEPQFASTCLFVWTCWQSGHDELSVFPHLIKLDAVGSCCCSAFFVKMKSGSGSFSISVDAADKLRLRCCVQEVCDYFPLWYSEMKYVGNLAVFDFPPVSSEQISCMDVVQSHSLNLHCRCCTPDWSHIFVFVEFHHVTLIKSEFLGCRFLWWNVKAPLVFCKS